MCDVTCPNAHVTLPRLLYVTSSHAPHIYSVHWPRREFLKIQPTMIGRLSLAFVVVSVAAFFCAQSVDAAKSPRITNKVFFDIKHGDESLGRSAFKFLPLCFPAILI